MTAEEYGVPCGFDSLFSKNVPHILEKIFFSVDYQSYKNCFEVNKAWHDLLTSESFQRKGRSVFHDALLEDEKKLHSASGEGDTHEVRRLLSTGMLDVNCVWQYNKTTPLSKAAENSHSDVVKLLLDSGADPNKADYVGQSLLLLAAANSHSEVVQRLLNSGADPSKADNYGRTPLHLAAGRGRKDSVQLLLNSGADPNKADSGGFTPLHRAARSGCKDIIQLLLNSGADPNKADNYGQTPLHWAAGHGHKDIVQLLHSVADPNKADSDGKTACDLAHNEDIAKMLNDAGS